MKLLPQQEENILRLEIAIKEDELRFARIRLEKFLLNKKQVVK